MRIAIRRRRSISAATKINNNNWLRPVFPNFRLSIKKGESLEKLRLNEIQSQSKKSKQ